MFTVDNNATKALFYAFYVKFLDTCLLFMYFVIILNSLKHRIANICVNKSCTNPDLQYCLDIQTDSLR